MPSLDARPPMPVRSLRSDSISTGVQLQWRAGSTDTTSYAVYRRDLAAGDHCPDNDARNLIGSIRSTGGQETFVDATAEKGHHYIYRVTALDRTWNQSIPLPTVIQR
jgi:hypothetical protein